MSSPVPLPPEKCLNGYCRSPVACNAFGYCRERNMREAIRAILAEHFGMVTIPEIARILERRGFMKLQPAFALDFHQHREIAGHVLALMEAGELANLLPAE